MIPDRWTDVSHVGGVPWWKAPTPRRWHRCRPQTTATKLYGLEVVDRCACGAIRLNGRFWLERNTRNRKATS